MDVIAEDEITRSIQSKTQQGIHGLIVGPQGEVEGSLQLVRIPSCEMASQKSLRAEILNGIRQGLGIAALADILIQPSHVLGQPEFAAAWMSELQLTDVAWHPCGIDSVDGMQLDHVGGEGR